MLSAGVATVLAMPIAFSQAFDLLSGPAGGMNDQFVVNGIASASDSYGSAAANEQMTANARAISTYGSLGVESFASFAIPGTPESGYSVAIGYVEDDLTISSAALNGSLGFLYVDYTLDGTIATSGAGSSVVQVSVEVLDSTSPDFQTSNTAYISSVSGTFRAPEAFTFIYGQPFELALCLGATTGMGIVPAVLPGSGHVVTFECAPGYVGGLTGSGTGTASFFNSLVLSGLTVTDSLGNPVNGAQFTSDSGTQYGPNGVVPEPGSLLMLGSGLTIVAMRYRKGHLAGALHRRSR